MNEGESCEQQVQFVIQNYKNRQRNITLGSKKPQMLSFKKLFITIAYRDKPNSIQDCIHYQKINHVSRHFINNNQITIIFLKDQEKASISFRVGCQEHSKFINQYITKKKQQLNNIPDYTLLANHKQKLIDKIKDIEPQYKTVYQMFAHRLPKNVLEQIVFGEHPDIVEYNRLAILKGIEIDKRMNIKRLNQRKPEAIQIESILQHYDFLKQLQGNRFHELDNKLKYNISTQDLQDELLFNEIKDMKQQDICDQFQQIQQELMQIQIHNNKELLIDDDGIEVAKMKLTKVQKGKLKLGSSSEKVENVMKVRQQRQEINVKEAKIITLILKMVYKLCNQDSFMDERGNKIEWISFIENELNRINNSQPKPPNYLQMPIKKALKNILSWKRSKNNMKNN